MNITLTINPYLLWILFSYSFFILYPFIIYAAVYILHKNPAVFSYELFFLCLFVFLIGRDLIFKKIFFRKEDIFDEKKFEMAWSTIDNLKVVVIYNFIKPLLAFIWLGTVNLWWSYLDAKYNSNSKEFLDRWFNVFEMMFESWFEVLMCFVVLPLSFKKVIETFSFLYNKESNKEHVKKLHKSKWFWAI